jgi:hypothetical protein
MTTIGFPACAKRLSIGFSDGATLSGGMMAADGIRPGVAGDKGGIGIGADASPREASGEDFVRSDMAWPGWAIGFDLVFFGERIGFPPAVSCF